MGLGPRSSEPESQPVRVCVRGHWRVDFFSNQLSPPVVQGTCRRLERFGGPVKTGRTGSLGGGACGPGGPPALCTPSGKNSGRRGQVKVSCQAAPAPRCPVHYQGQSGLLRCWAQRLQPAKELNRGQRSRLQARLPPSARRPRSRRWDRWNRAARGPAGSGRAALAGAWRRGVAQPQRPGSFQRTPATCQCAPLLRLVPRGGGRGTPPPRPAGFSTRSCLEGGHCPPSLCPCWQSARRTGSGARSCPPPTLPPTRRPGFFPGHSPPQLSALCSRAGNDLRKRLGQGLRQAARARR